MSRGGSGQNVTQSIGAEATSRAIKKLIKGQEKMGKDISEMKVDISVLKTEQAEMKADISEMKVNQQQFEGLIHKVLDGVARIERVVVNIENVLRPKVNILLDADKFRQDDTAELKQTCREQEKSYIITYLEYHDWKNNK